MDDKKRKKIIKAVRDSIITAAREAGVVKGKADGLAKKVGDKWQASKPHQQKAMRNVQGAAESVVAFSRSVAQGVREGVREVSKKNRPARKSHKTTAKKKI